MFLLLDEIEDEALGFEGTLALDGLRGDDDRPLVIGAARLAGQTRRGSRGVELTGRWSATVRLACSRCLEPHELELEEALFLVLVGQTDAEQEGEREMDPEEACVFEVEGSRVDLAPVVAEQVQLALPLKPLCRADCAGLCPTCGANRNRIQCACREKTVDPRLAPLLEIKNRLD